jgi:predicted nucleic acid-binding protein
MSSNARLLFDTHAFLAYFNKERGSETIKHLMDAIQSEESEGFVATISLTELAYIYSRRADKASATLRVSQIQHSTPSQRRLPSTPESPRRREFLSLPLSSPHPHSPSMHPL